jgi:hypothetical protein
MIDETDKRDNAAPERDNASERPGERHDRDSGPRESLRQNLEDAWRAHGGELPEKDDDRRRSAEPRNRPARAKQRRQRRATRKHRKKPGPAIISPASSKAWQASAASP